MANKRCLVVRNCRVIHAPEKSTDLLIEDGKIARIGKVKSWPKEYEIIDARNKIIAPGFIDVHIQGGGGASILDGTKEALQTISRTCAKFGTTGFLATSVFYPGKENRHLKITAENVGCDLGGANLLGIHLEGPFISAEKKGGILLNSITKPSLKVLKKISDICQRRLRMMTIAPELPGNSEIIGRLVNSGVSASFGHANASYEETLKGIDAGITHVTHFFNAMLPIHHRFPGPIPAILERSLVTCQVITDGVHIHPGIINLFFKLLGPDRFATITDGLTSLGLSDGRYSYDGVEYVSKNGTGRRDNGTLVGTTLGLNQALYRLMKFTGCDLQSAVKTVTETPARTLGLEKKKGRVESGKDADLVILNADCSVYSTIVGGKVVKGGGSRAGCDPRPRNAGKPPRI
ncbi:MAG: N-acetylglucosamine-6-phosphate deacetylase [Candidatus Omnitrophota bacterium]